MGSAETYSGPGGPEFELQDLPPIGQASPAQLRAWVDKQIYYTHRLRALEMATWRRAELYDAGIQWLRHAYAGYDTGGTSSQWVQAYWNKSDPNYVPTPVFNEGLGARQNESARLAAPNPRPKVSPRSARPEVTTRQGAVLATDMSRHRLLEMGWESQAWLMYLHMPLYGGAWVRSSWDESWDKTVMVPVQGAVACPRHAAYQTGEAQPKGEGTCDFVLASPDQPAAGGGPAPWLGSVATPVGEPVTRCPHCPDHPELKPFQPSMEEAAGMQDAQGQPLGVRRALGDWQVDVVNPRDIFVADLGMGMLWGQVNQWVSVETKHMDWIGAHWPQEAGEVKPEKAALLAKYHPVAGAPDVLHSILDAKLFREHARLKQWHKAPWHERTKDRSGGYRYSEELNQGRSVVIAGNVKLFDGPFLLDSQTKPGETVPRVHMEYIPWEIRDGGLRIQGLSLWETLFDAQDTGNEARSQTQAVRQRIAVPMYAVLRDWNMQLVEARSGMPGRFVEMDPDERSPLQTPALFNNDTIDSGVAAEIEEARAFIERSAQRTGVERGDVPASMPALAIRLLKGASAEGRQPRVDRINQALKRTFHHGALLQSNMYVEPREYKFEGEDGEERWASAKGIDLEHQTDVEIEAEPGFDEKAQNQETVKMLLEQGLLDPTESKMQRRRILTHMDVPKDLMEGEKLQEAAAQREWIAFRDEGRLPRVDPGLDSHGDHFEEHGNRCQTEYFRDLEERAGWDGVLKILGANWAERLQMLVLAPQDIDTQMAMAGLPLPVSLTELDMQDRVATFWGFLLVAKQFEVQDKDALQAVLSWRSHMEAHRLLEESAQMQAMAQPTLAQPGAEQTPSGGQPAPGAPPEGPPA